MRPLIDLGEDGVEEETSSVGGGVSTPGFGGGCSRLAAEMSSPGFD